MTVLKIPRLSIVCLALQRPPGAIALSRWTKKQDHLRSIQHRSSNNHLRFIDDHLEQQIKSSVFFSFCLSVSSDQSKAYQMIKEALWVDGWDGMVIIGHRFSKGTFGANSDEENRSQSESTFSTSTFQCEKFGQLKAITKK